MPAILGSACVRSHDRYERAFPYPEDSKMPFRLLSMLVALAAASSAFGQEPATVYKLRNVAATDAVQSVSAYATQKKLSVTVVAEPRTNVVFIAGDAGHQKLVVELIAMFDKAQPKVDLVFQILDVPHDFAESTGLGEGEKWILTAREVRMLKATIARDKGHGITVISEPSLLLTDNNTGIFTTKNQDITIRATPRIAPKGDSILLKVEAQSAKSRTEPLFNGEKTIPVAVMNTQVTQTTESIPEGCTLLVRAIRSKTENEIRDVFVLVTSNIIK